MRLHLVALPHTQVNTKFCTCAYTMKVLKFCKMMRYHEIFLYAPEGSDVWGVTFVPCLTNQRRLEVFGPDNFECPPKWPTDEQFGEFNKQVIEELKKRVEPRDLILLSGGYSQRNVDQAFPNHIVCESGVGYLGVTAKYCAFESYAWMHYVHGKLELDGRWFDTVIPNYFNPDDFPLVNRGQRNYLLFVGRIVKRKGPDVASAIAQACGLPLVVVGPGGKQIGADVVSDEVVVKNATYAGTVGISKLAGLLGGARALLVPTVYIEPFGGVAVEAMMCGTPVIATDWGAFTETVVNGISGFRFRTLKEAIRAVDSCNLLNPKQIHRYAIKRYSFEAVAPRFEHWFDQLNSLWKKGWYESI